MNQIRYVLYLNNNLNILQMKYKSNNKKVIWNDILPVDTCIKEKNVKVLWDNNRINDNRNDNIIWNNINSLNKYNNNPKIIWNNVN